MACTSSGWGGVGVSVAVGVAVGMRDAVGVLVADGVWLGSCVGVKVGLGLAVAEAAGVVVAGDGLGAARREQATSDSTAGSNIIRWHLHLIVTSRPDRDSSR